MECDPERESRIRKWPAQETGCSRQRNVDRESTGLHDQGRKCVKREITARPLRGGKRRNPGTRQGEIGKLGWGRPRYKPPVSPLATTWNQISVEPGLTSMREWAKRWKYRRNTRERGAQKRGSRCDIPAGGTH